MHAYPGNDLDLGSIVDSAVQLILSRQDRARHTWMAGATRTGKSKAMEGSFRQDVRLWPNYRCPLVLIDPHGTLYDSIVEYIAAENLRRLPVIPIDLRRNDLVVSYNLLRRREGADAGVIVLGFVEAILHAWGQSNSNETPRLATWLLTLLMLAYERECTLAEALELIRNPELRGLIIDDVQHIVARTALKSAEHLKETEFQDRVESTLNRINRFLGTALLRATLCQSGASLDMSSVLEQGSIVLVTTSTAGGRIAEEDARTFGSLLLSDLWTTARRRGKREEGMYRPCYVYIDEFHNFVSPSIATGLAEASGFGLNLTLAHQYPSQLSDRGEIGKMILNSVLANAKNKICFQLSHPEDLEMLSRILYRQHIDPNLIKHKIYSTKAMDHVLSYLPSLSKSHTISKTNGTQWSHAVGESASHMDQWSHTDGLSDAVTVGDTFAEGETQSKGSNKSLSDGDENGASTENETSGKSSVHTSILNQSQTVSSADTHGGADTIGHNTTQTDGGSEANTTGSTTGITMSPMQIPVMGKELSSVQYVPIDEQLFGFMQLIDGLPDRHCVVRTASGRRTMRLYTTTVKKPLTTLKFAAGFTVRALDKLAFVTPMIDALARITERERTFAVNLLNCSSNQSDQPVTAKHTKPQVKPPTELP